MPLTVLYALCIFAAAGFAQGEMTEEQQKMAKNLHDNCVKESGVNEDFITGAAKGNFEDDPNLKCYMKCLYVKMGLFSESDLKINQEAFVKMVPEAIKDATARALAECLPIVGEDACEMAFNLNKCFYSFDPDKYMIV